MASAHADRPRMALVMGLNLSGDRASLPTIALVDATHALRVLVDASQAPAPARTTVTLVGPNGERMAFGAADGVALVAPIPHARYELDVVAVDNHQRRLSRLHRELNTPDFGATDTVVTAALLAPPSIGGPVALRVGMPLSWPVVPGARGYRVALTGLAGQGFVWEGFAPTPAMAFSHEGRLDRAAYQLSLSAWDHADLSPRIVASLGARQLRALPAAGDYRMSSVAVSATAAP